MDKQHNKETFQLAYKAGLRIISFGLENGSQKVLDLMNKGIELEIAQRVIRNSSEAGIWNNIYLMLGFPGETEEDIQHTKKFLEESESYIDTLGYGEFRLDGYSKVFRQPEKYGIWIEKYSKDYFGTGYSFKRNSNNSLEYIKQFEKYLLKFKFHPSYFIGIDLNILLTNLSQNRKDIIKEQIILSNKHRQAAYLLTSGSFSDIYVKSCIENYKCIDNEREKVYLFYSRLSGMSIQLIGDLDILLHEAKKGAGKKYLQILKKDLKRKKTMNLILFIFIVLAATFIAGSVNNMVTVMTALDTFFEKAEVLDCLLSFADEGEAKQFEQFARQEQYSIRQQEVIQIDPKKMEKEDGEMNYNNTVVISRIGDSVRIFDSYDQEVTHINDGEIYFAVKVLESEQVQVKDHVRIAANGKEGRFAVAGGVRDAIFASEMAGMTRVFVSDKDYSYFDAADAEHLYLTCIYTRLYNFYR